MDKHTELLLWKCLRRILFNQKWIMVLAKIKSKEPEKDTSILIDDCDKIISALLTTESPK